MYLYQEIQNRCTMAYKVFILILAFSWSLSSIFAQSGTSGSRASATVVEPILQTKSVDLNFDRVAIIIAGMVELIPSDFRTSPENITLPVTMGTFTAASFLVSGTTTAYTYKITVPSSPLEITNGKNNLIVQSLDTDSMQNSDSDLLAGVFVSVSPLNVTVNYN